MMEGSVDRWYGIHETAHSDHIPHTLVKNKISIKIDHSDPIPQTCWSTMQLLRITAIPSLRHAGQQCNCYNSNPMIPSLTPC